MDKRITIQRQAILHTLKELDIHATAEQVYGQIIKKYPAISKATVYRNLNQMVESGELLNIGSFYGAVHYDHNCHPHYHFLCEHCRQIFDVEGYLPDLTGLMEELDGFEIKEHTLTFRGLCRNCSTGKDAL